MRLTAPAIKKVRPIQDVDWYFGAIPGQEYRVAVLYEFARDVLWVQEDTQTFAILGEAEWSPELASLIGENRKTESFRSIDQLLKWMSKNPLSYKNLNLMEALRRSMTEDLFRSLGSLPIFVPEFPLAWQSLTRIRDVVSHMREAGVDFESLNLHRFPPINSEQAALDAAEFAQKICSGLNGLEAQYVGQMRHQLVSKISGSRKPRRRERSWSDANLLKFLAARRLRKAGLSFNQACQMVDEEAPHATNPNTKDQTAFGRYIRNADQISNQFFPSDF